QNNLGLAHFKSAKLQEAVKDFKEAVRLQPDYAEAHFNLGFAYLTMKDAKGFRDEVVILRTLNPAMADKLSGFARN
ncbi:MAG TPA: tetratricopeptide repeat protein, partial [Pyrinomonadaceae bacterium]|nr:tetratricopeptide repeat protein [Pyrinomonadaceae bacterium]